ncbi:MAG: hypothetical protein NVSMB55_14400 [Mycobacteriales bacterium]
MFADVSAESPIGSGAAAARPIKCTLMILLREAQDLGCYWRERRRASFPGRVTRVSDRERFATRCFR